ncbi:MAG: PHP domain-containing protein [Phycisphaerae bacterium]
MTNTETDQTGGDLASYRAREAALYHVRDALAQADAWDAFEQALSERGVPEARVRQVVDPPVTMDLHTHSTYSDGEVPPRKLAWLARVLGLETLGLTDHDSVAGTRDLYAEAMLLGVSAVPGVELSTGRSGLEILVYFPDVGQFFGFLTTPRGARFTKYLQRKQQAVHEVTLKVLASVNRWLKKQGVPAEEHVTEAELDAWFGGRPPYYPGTVAVLGLKRLDERRRKRLGIHDPRAFNTQVVTPALKRLGGAGGTRTGVDEATEEVRAELARLQRAGVGSVVILSHPKELVTKGKMTLGQVARTIRYLAAEARLDGVEVGCARDTEADVQVWREMIDEVNADIAGGNLSAPGPLLVASYTSDFHVLAPGRATGEITLGFGLLDERPGHRRGNLRPQTGAEELLEALRRRAALRAQG